MPLEQNHCATNGSGNRLKKRVAVGSGSCVVQGGFQEQTTPHSQFPARKSQMKGASAVLSVTALVARLPNQLTLVSVWIHVSYLLFRASHYLLFYAADSPKISSHPKDLNNAVPGKSVAFTIHAIGTKPLMYQWQWQPAGEESTSEEWRDCDAKSFPDAVTNKLIISSVQKLKEGSYRCVVSNRAGIQTSTPANLHVGRINFCSEVKNFHYVL